MDKLILDLARRVEREVENLRRLMALQGSLDLVLSASRASEKPDLRREETLLRDKLAGKPVCPDMNLSMDKVLIT